MRVLKSAGNLTTPAPGGGIDASIWMLYLRGSGLLLVDESNAGLLFFIFIPRLRLFAIDLHRKTSAIITPLNIARARQQIPVPKLE